MTAKHHHQPQSGSHRTQPGTVKGHPRLPWWKRKPHWLVAAVVPTVIAGLTLTWLVWLAGPPNNQTTSSPSGSDSSGSSAGVSASGPPVLINVYHEQLNDQTAFPGALYLSSRDLKNIGGQGIVPWAAPRGGYDISQTIVKLTLTARRPVRILEMQAVILSARAPLSGTIFMPAEQGAVPNTAIDISLANISPVAMVVGGDGLPSSEPYFMKYSYTLKAGEQTTFDITAFSGLQLYQPVGNSFLWQLKITLLDRNSVKNLYVNDADNKPFATTGTTATGATAISSAYKVVYGQCLYTDFKTPICKNVPNYEWIRYK
jgi:hypothetical protein